MEGRDLEALRHFYLKIRRKTFPWKDIENFALEDFEKDSEGEVVDVAELNGVLVGFISVWQPDDFVHSLYVDESAHGQGIGKALMAKGLLHLQRPVCLKCQSKNTQALDIYAHWGWKKIDQGGEGAHQYWMLQQS